MLYLTHYITRHAQPRLHPDSSWPSLRFSRIGGLALVLLVLAAAACTAISGEANPPGPAEPAATEVPRPTATTRPTTAPTATPTAQPVLTPTPTAVPTATPRPTATATAVPPPPAQPSPMPVQTQSSESLNPRGLLPAITRLAGGAELKIFPDSPVAGREVYFRLEGIRPWTFVDVTFIDAQGLAHDWVTSEDVHLVQSTGTPLRTFQVAADGAGNAEWVRYNTLDAPGKWSVRVSFDGQIELVGYTLEDLHLADLEQTTLGTPLSGYHGEHSDTFFSEFVPAAYAVDLQDELADASRLLDRRLGVRTDQVPELYLLGNRSLLDVTSQATQVNLGFEDGYYRNFGIKPGIYMRADLLKTEVRALMVHEYVHLVFDGVANGKQLPAWVTEGLAEFYEVETGLEADRPNATKLRYYRTLDEVRTAAAADSLPSLTGLESQRDWNAKTDQTEISLQYATAQMAVRYLSGTYGPKTLVEMVEDIGRGEDLDAALLAATGLSLPELDTQLNRWLRDWEDPERSDSAIFFGGLDALIAEQVILFDRRAADLAAQNRPGESFAIRSELVQEAENLVRRLEALSAPESQSELHQDGIEFFRLVVRWLGLELQHAQTRNDSFRLEANALISEVDARDTNLRRGLSNAKYILGLRD